jgi:DNA polymerase III subunit gamma/tau
VFQSLYRRYRPQRFAEVRGQDHVTAALRNAVRDGTVAHAYLLSGPRGTGKTSSARILAKALNCEAPTDGEPCGTCESCKAVEAGRSLDVIELDAASNNGVDAMRDLVARASLGTGGRAKVYIVDEVHMLSTAASNVLLKPLEEPPAHVTWVLATTDPQKVLPTIRSRTQHFEFRLLSAAVLADHVRWVAADAGLHLDDAAVEQAVRRGRGSARDTLSALDQIIAGGSVADDDAPVDEIVEALCERDTGRALAGVALAANGGRDIRGLAEALLASLRDALLAVLAPDVVSLPDDALARVSDQGRRLGPPAITRALDAVGQALLDMREAPDPRVSFEVALVRITRPELDTSPAALVERLERLERGQRSGGAGPGPRSDVPADAAPPSVGGARPALGGVRRPAAQSPAGRSPDGRPLDARPPSETLIPAASAAPIEGAPVGVDPTPTTVGTTPDDQRSESIAALSQAPPAHRAAAPVPEPPPMPSSAPSVTTPAPAPPGTQGEPGAGTVAGFPTRDELALAWGDTILRSLKARVKGLYGSGRFVAVEDGHAVFGFESPTLVEMANQARSDVEAGLAAHFGQPVPVKIVVAPGSGPVDGPPVDAHEEPPDLAELTDAPPDARSPIDHLRSAFPGAELLADDGS